ncbi:MAG: glycosyltransferase [Rikenellaceae bacterium]
MITFICCSVNPTLAAKLNENIAQTAGVPFEFIAYDNRVDGYGICRVYNNCAKDAKYDYLCFVHEDVIIKSNDWAAKIIAKLQESDCGVIGFAGSAIKHQSYSGWGCLHEATRINVIQHRKNGNITRELHNPREEEFSQVITLDGLCLFARRDVWQHNQFDEVLLDRFHCYDLDFALSVAQNYKNYVCFTLDIEHLSTGSFNEQWVEATRKLHQKWQDRLPMYTPEWEQMPIDDKITKIEYRIARHMMKHLKALHSPSDTARDFFSRYWNKSSLAWLILLKYLTDKLKS